MQPARYDHAVSNLQVKNVPDSLHQELRRRAARAGLTVRDYVLRLIEADQRLPSTEEWLDDVRSHPPVPVSAADAVRAVAEGRQKRDGALLDRISSADPG